VASRRGRGEGALAVHSVRRYTPPTRQESLTAVGAFTSGDRPGEL